MANSKLLTAHTSFNMVTVAGKAQYHPDTVAGKAAAKASGDLPTHVQGYGVYDATVSTEYAVAVYGSVAEAQAHKAQPAPETTDTLFDEPPADTDEADEEFAAAEPTKRSYKAVTNKR